MSFVARKQSDLFFVEFNLWIFAYHVVSLCHFALFFAFGNDSLQGCGLGNVDRFGISLASAVGKAWVTTIGSIIYGVGACIQTFGSNSHLLSYIVGACSRSKYRSRNARCGNLVVYHHLIYIQRSLLFARLVELYLEFSLLHIGIVDGKCIFSESTC